MADRTLEQVFVRIFSYLTDAGVEMNRARCRALLRLIDDTLAETGDIADAEIGSEAQLIEESMDRLPAYFPIVFADPPQQCPALSRSSIGYPGRG